MNKSHNMVLAWLFRPKVHMGVPSGALHTSSAMMDDVCCPVRRYSRFLIIATVSPTSYLPKRHGCEVPRCSRPHVPTSFDFSELQQFQHSLALIKRQIDATKPLAFCSIEDTFTRTSRCRHSFDQIGLVPLFQPNRESRLCSSSYLHPTDPSMPLHNRNLSMLVSLQRTVCSKVYIP